MTMDLNDLLSGRPGVMEQIAIRFRLQTSLLEATYKRDYTAAMKAVEAMLVSCKKAGVDPLECVTTKPRD